LQAKRLGLLHELVGGKGRLDFRGLYRRLARNQADTLFVRCEYRRAASPGAATPWTIARYRKTGRSNDEPLNVTSWGESAAILSTNDVISSFSGRSPTCGAPSRAHPRRRAGLV
jgi:hypothetical protein